MQRTDWKRSWCWERLKVGGEGDKRGWDGWMASPTWWTWIEQALGVGDGQGSLVCCSPWGRKESDRIEWTELKAGKGFPGSSAGKESACNAGDPGLIPGLGKSPGGGHGNPLQYFCLENPHGQRSLAGYSPWGCKESNMTERLSTAQQSKAEKGGRKQEFTAVVRDRTNHNQQPLFRVTISMLSFFLPNISLRLLWGWFHPPSTGSNPQHIHSHIPGPWHQLVFDTQLGVAFEMSGVSGPEAVGGLVFLQVGHRGPWRKGWRYVGAWKTKGGAISPILGAILLLFIFPTPRESFSCRCDAWFMSVFPYGLRSWAQGTTQREEIWVKWPSHHHRHYSPGGEALLTCTLAFSPRFFLSFASAWRFLGWKEQWRSYSTVFLITEPSGLGTGGGPKMWHPTYRLGPWSTAPLWASVSLNFTFPSNAHDNGRLSGRFKLQEDLCFFPFLFRF